MKKSFFYGKIIEEKWETGLFYEDGFHLVEDHFRSWNNSIPMKYEKISKQRVFFHDVLSVEFEASWKVRIDREVITIEDVIRRLDGSIEYYTDKVIERIKL